MKDKAKELFDERYTYYRGMLCKPAIPLEARELIFNLMVDFAKEQALSKQPTTEQNEDEIKLKNNGFGAAEDAIAKANTEQKQEQIDLSGYWIIELSDGEYQVHTKEGLEKIEADCIEFDGIIPYRVVAKVSNEITPNQDWISVEERPLYTLDENNNWVCTKDGEEEFLAVVKLSEQTKRGLWIRHCVVEDETGLCVVGDDFNDKAGWDIEDVTHWMPIPPFTKEERSEE